jgi:hypothetical protein
MLIGLHDPAHTTGTPADRVNPPEDTEIRSGMQLIYLAKSAILDVPL